MCTATSTENRPEASKIWTLLGFHTKFYKILLYASCKKCTFFFWLSETYSNNYYGISVFNCLISWTDHLIVRVKTWKRFESNLFHNIGNALILLCDFQQLIPVLRELFLAALSALWAPFHSYLGPWDHTHPQSPQLGHLQEAPQVALQGPALLLEEATVSCNSKCTNNTHITHP